MRVFAASGVVGNLRSPILGALTSVSRSGRRTVRKSAMVVHTSAAWPTSLRTYTSKTSEASSTSPYLLSRWATLSMLRAARASAPQSCVWRGQ